MTHIQDPTMGDPYEAIEAQMTNPQPAIWRARVTPSSEWPERARRIEETIKAAHPIPAPRRRSRLRQFSETPIVQVSCWVIIFCAGIAVGVFMAVAGS